VHTCVTFKFDAGYMYIYVAHIYPYCFCCYFSEPPAVALPPLTNEPSILDPAPRGIPTGPEEGPNHRKGQEQPQLIGSAATGLRNCTVQPQ